MEQPKVFRVARIYLVILAAVLLACIAARSILPAMLIGLQRKDDYLYILGGEDLPRHRNNGVYRARVRDLLAAARN